MLCFQYIQDAVDTLIGPVFGILCIQLFRQEGRIGIDVGRLIGKDLDGAGPPSDPYIVLW